MKLYQPVPSGIKEGNSGLNQDFLQAILETEVVTHSLKPFSASDPLTNTFGNSSLQGNKGPDTHPRKTPEVTRPLEAQPLVRDAHLVPRGNGYPHART